MSFSSSTQSSKPLASLPLQNHMNSDFLNLLLMLKADSQRSQFHNSITTLSKPMSAAAAPISTTGATAADGKASAIFRMQNEYLLEDLPSSLVEEAQQKENETGETEDQHNVISADSEEKVKDVVMKDGVQCIEYEISDNEDEQIDKIVDAYRDEEQDADGDAIASHNIEGSDNNSSASSTLSLATNSFASSSVLLSSSSSSASAYSLSSPLIPDIRCHPRLLCDVSNDSSRSTASMDSAAAPDTVIEPIHIDPEPPNEAEKKEFPRSALNDSDGKQNYNSQPSAGIDSTLASTTFSAASKVLSFPSSTSSSKFPCCAKCGSFRSTFQCFSLPLCSRCLSESYCSVECQRAHWEEHRRICWPSEKQKTRNKKPTLQTGDSEKNEENDEQLPLLEFPKDLLATSRPLNDLLNELKELDAEDDDADKDKHSNSSYSRFAAVPSSVLSSILSDAPPSDSAAANVKSRLIINHLRPFAMNTTDDNESEDELELVEASAEETEKLLTGNSISTPSSSTQATNVSTSSLPTSNLKKESNRNLHGAWSSS